MERGSTLQMLRSSALIGGSSVIVLAVGMVRTKAWALLLGPGGIGLIGLYSAVLELASSVAGMGLKSSGIRQIAEAAGRDEPGRAAATAALLRRLSLGLGVLGAAAMVMLAPMLSRITFGDASHATGVAVLGLAVALNVVAGGHAAVIQGMRRIGDLARMGVAGAVLGTTLGIALVTAWGEAAVVPALVGVAATSCAVAAVYARRLRRDGAPVAAAEPGEAAALLKLGLAFMASAFLMMGSGYVVRVIVTRELGLAATGLYQAAWALGGLYVSFVLQSMSADFYPRLVAVCRDAEASKRLVNEQAHVSLLLAAPGVLATLVYAPLVLTLFYSSEFGAAAGMLRWVCLGMALRVITWPMGYLIVAQGRRGLFFATELAWTVVGIALAWACVKRWGLDGAGLAFCLSYVFHGLMIYPIVHVRAGFRWTRANLGRGALLIVTTAGTLAAFALLPPAWALALGTLAVLASAVQSVRAILALVATDQLPQRLRPLADALRLKLRVAG